MILLKQSASVTLLFGPFVDEDDGKTAETGLTITQADVRLSKNGGNMAQKNESTAFTHDELGFYTCLLDATDTNTLGQLTIAVHESGALPVWMNCLVVTANIYDSLCSTDILQSDLTQIGGVAQSATDLKDFADAGYDPGTNKVQGVVLVDTTTTNTDMVGTDSAALASVCTEGRLAELDAANLPTDVDAILADTGTDGVVIAAAQTVATVTTLTGHTVQTGDSFARLGAPVGASISADIAVVDGVADAILLDTGTDGVLIAAGGANTVADQVWEEAIADHSGTGGSTAEALAGASAPSAASVADAVWDEAIAGHAGAGSTGEALSGASAPSAATVADAVWDETNADHVAAGSTGKNLSDAGGGASAATIADAVWDEAQSDHTATGSTGDSLNTAANTGTTATATTTIDETTLDVGGTALGAIQDENSTAIVGAIIAAYADADTSLGTPLYQTTTDGDGGYDLRVADGATYRISVTYQGYSTSAKRVTV